MEAYISKRDSVKVKGTYLGFSPAPHVGKEL
jgi:hypothetical protein